MTTFTGNSDVDIVIINSLSWDDIHSFCRINISLHDLCLDNKILHEKMNVATKKAQSLIEKIGLYHRPMFLDNQPWLYYYHALYKLNALRITGPYKDYLLMYINHTYDYLKTDAYTNFIDILNKPTQIKFYISQIGYDYRYTIYFTFGLATLSFRLTYDQLIYFLTGAYFDHVIE